VPATDEAPLSVIHAPRMTSSELNESPTMSRVVVGFDGGDESRDALCFAGRLARLEGAALAVAAVGLFEPQVSSEAERVASTNGRRAIFAAVSEVLGPRSFEPRTVEGLPAARGLIRLAEADGADLIVVGSTRRGRLGRVFLGSVGAQLLHGSPCPVAVIPRGFRNERREVRGALGIAYDGSPEADLALAEAVHLSRVLEVGVRLIGVVPPMELLDVPREERVADDLRRGEELSALLERAAATVDDGVETEIRLLTGDPGQALVTAGDDLDMLVLGSRGRGRLGRTVLGSVSAHVSCNAECPVIVVPRGAEPVTGAGEAFAARLSANPG
jgi:nucleotide-binding universal stress UspA family protein